MAEDIFITAAARTAMGSFQGALRDLTAPEIGGTAIAAVVDQQSLDKTLIDEVIMGCVLPAGLGQARPSGQLCGRTLRICTLHHSQQNVRFWYEGCNAGL